MASESHSPVLCVENKCSACEKTVEQWAKENEMGERRQRLLSEIAKKAEADRQRANEKKAKHERVMEYRSKSVFTEYTHKHRHMGVERTLITKKKSTVKYRIGKLMRTAKKKTEKCYAHGASGCSVCYNRDRSWREPWL
jgi:hypothetical protein